MHSLSYPPVNTLTTRIVALQPSPPHRRPPLPRRRPPRTGLHHRRPTLDLGALRNDHGDAVVPPFDARLSRSHGHEAGVRDGRRPPSRPLAVRVQRCCSQLAHGQLSPTRRPYTRPFLPRRRRDAPARARPGQEALGPDRDVPAEFPRTERDLDAATTQVHHPQAPRHGARLARSSLSPSSPSSDRKSVV